MDERIISTCAPLDWVQAGIISKVFSKDDQGIMTPFNNSFWGSIVCFSFHVRMKTKAVWIFFFQSRAEVCIEYKLELGLAGMAYMCQSADWWLANSLSVSSLEQSESK